MTINKGLVLGKIKEIFNEFNTNREYKKYALLINNAARNLSTDELVDLLISDELKRFFWMIQVTSEIKSLLNTVASIKPKTVLEIGTKNGGTLFLFTKVATQDGQIISIDFPDGHGGFYPNSRYNFYKMFAVPPQQINLIKGDSHWQSTKDELLQLVGSKKIDFLFIDGDHSFEGVKMDFEMYGPLVRPGGLVAFHDIKPTKENNWSGVIPFWSTIKGQYKSTEFLGPEENWGGIGVIEI